MTTGMTFNNKLSLFIPRIVPEWASQDMIVDKFKTLDIGTINRVDFLEKQSANGVKYFQAFLHFETWDDNAATRNIQERIYDSESSARLVYDEPWYWILLKNNNPLTEEEVVVSQANVALQERICELEEQVSQIQTNMIYWNNLVFTQMNCYNYQLAPLWAHAMNSGMGDIHPEWVNNDDSPPTMSQLAEQSAMIADDYSDSDSDSDSHDSIPSLIDASDEDDTDTDTESESSSLPVLVSDNESDYSEDETVIQTPPHYTSSVTPITPEHNYTTTTNYPYDNNAVIDLTEIFNAVG
jgi:hypothetical protein